jgi:hypothetical protein
MRPNLNSNKKRQTLAPGKKTKTIVLLKKKENLTNNKEKLDSLSKIFPKILFLPLRVVEAVSLKNITKKHCFFPEK